jgi:type IV secretion system protein VirB9
VKLACGFVAAWFIAGSANGAVTPQPGPGDPHIQSVEYDAQQVVVLRLAFNYALTIEFSPDERIENVAVGNSAVWQVTADKSADRLFVKPMQTSGDTDMTVVTDTRIYTFELQTAPSPDASMAYVVRFHYPAAPGAALAANPIPLASVYRFEGARELRPLSMSDDGRSTMITWAAKTPYPAVLIVADGKETLANGTVRDGRLVIDDIADRFIFRAGGRTAFATRHVVRPR